MNALLHRKEIPTVTSNENDDLGTQVAEIRLDVRHIQTDVTDIKAQLGATNQRIDKLGDDLNGRIDDLYSRMDKLKDDLNGRIDKLKDSLHSSRIWAFGLYGSLLFVLAKGFKWL